MRRECCATLSRTRVRGRSPSDERNRIVRPLANCQLLRTAYASEGFHLLPPAVDLSGFLVFTHDVRRPLV